MLREKNVFGKIILLMMVVVLLAACGNSTSSGDDADTNEGEVHKIQIGYVTTDAEDDPYAMSANLFKEYAEELTDGQVEIELLPNGQLGEEREMVEGMQVGTVDGGIITNAYLSSFEEKALVFDLPFLFSDYENAHEVADGEVGDIVIEGLREIGIVGLGWTEGGFRTMINNTRPIYEPADAEGIKFRSQENPMYLKMFELIGANPTPMAWGEVFTGVQQGTVDGLEAPVAVLLQSKFHEISDYLTLTNHTYSPLLISISEITWDKLSDEQQEKLIEAAELTVKEQREKTRENLENMLDEFRDAGVEVNEINDVEQFQDKVMDIYEEFRDEIGDEIMSLLGF